MIRTSLQERLEQRAVPMALSRAEGRERVRCLACGHRCLIPEGHAGICKVRFNRGGVLYGPRGYVAGLQDDPIEKKPFYHVLPGTRALSFGMLGCSFHCSYCNNWVSSQALKDPLAGTDLHAMKAEALVEQAQRIGALTLASTYNEPLITTEWAVQVFCAAKAAGLRTAYVSNGMNTEEAVACLRPHLDFYKVDLKCFDDRHYRKLGGTLQKVLDGIQRVQRAGFWLEVVTLVVPGFNDTDAELRGTAGFLAELSRDIPWHVIAFYPEYRMLDTPPTPRATVLRACEIGRTAGLRYVYPGNLHGGAPGGQESTWCPHCDALLVTRQDSVTLAYRLEDGRCPRCQATIPGVWHDAATLARHVPLRGHGARPLAV